MGKFIVKETKKGAKFDLKAGNGEVIISSQTYATLASCKNGINSVKKNASVAVIEDQTSKGYEQKRNPKFEIYTDRKGEFRFRLKAGNGSIVCTSKGYKAKKSCLNGIASLVKNAEGPIEVEKAKK